MHLGLGRGHIGERSRRRRARGGARVREASRAIIRIVTNYVRLGVNLALGLVFVQFVFRWIGNDAQGLIALLASGVGIAAMFREITSRAVIRELGAAYHETDRPRFAAVYNSALCISLVTALIAAVFFVVLYFCEPLLTVPDSLDGAAKVLILSQLGYIFVTTAVSPTFNMLIVTERFVSYNLWTLAERSVLLAAALLTRYALDINDPARAISTWAPIVAAAQSAVVVLPVLILFLREGRLRPRLGLANRPSVRAVSTTFGWYLVVELSSNLHERVGPFVMNKFFGLYSNTVFGSAYQFVSYVCQATRGITFGIDAVSARLSARGARKSLLALMHHSTRLHGLVAIPTGFIIAFLAGPLVRWWLSGHINDEEKYLPSIITTVQIMSIPVTARAIADGWVFILYGAGFIRRYAPLIFFGALCNPVISIVLHFTLGASIDRPRTLFITPVVFAVVYTIVHFFLLPIVGARCLGLKYADFYRPLWRPIFATVLASPVLIFMPDYLRYDLQLEPRTLRIFIVCVLFGILYSGLALVLVLSSEERQRFVWGPIRRLLGRKNAQTPGTPVDSGS